MVYEYGAHIVPCNKLKYEVYQSIIISLVKMNDERSSFSYLEIKQSVQPSISDLILFCPHIFFDKLDHMLGASQHGIVTVPKALTHLNMFQCAISAHTV